MVNYEQILSARVKEVQPSGIRRFFELAAKMPHAISLGVGEPDFETPWQIRRAGIQSLEKGQTFYTSNWGLAELRNQIAALVRRKYRLCYDADKEILVTVGGSEAIDNTIRALVNVGDEVLIPEPSFVCYKPLTQMAGGVPVPLPTRAEDQFKLTADSLRAAITPRTKLLILPYPNNPTGAIMTRDELQAIATVIKDTNIVVLSDEIYNSLTYGPDRHVCFAELDGMKERTVIERVNNAAVQAGRDPSEITLVAATKMNDAERVQAAIEAGIRVCGENRVQELQEKYEQNAYDGADLQFIGTLQTNKVKYLIGKVSLIQSVGSVHLGEAIAKEAEKRGVCQDILLEVNIGREAAKSGLPPEELHDAIVKLSAKKSLHIRGLMAIPPVADEKTKNSNYFTEMRQVFIDILTKKYDNVDMDYLSMGMTNDFETAIACGANMVRVGTAIFGKRPYQIVSP